MTTSEKDTGVTPYKITDMERPLPEGLDISTTIIDPSLLDDQYEDMDTDDILEIDDKRKY